MFTLDLMICKENHYPQAFISDQFMYSQRRHCYACLTCINHVCKEEWGLTMKLPVYKLNPSFKCTIAHNETYWPKVGARPSHTPTPKFKIVRVRQF